MSEGSSLIDLGTLSEPATKLIEKVSDAIGALYETRGIRERAEAKAEAEVVRARGQAEAKRILAEAEHEIRDVEARALNRVAKRELRRQENIEKITAGAAATIDGEIEPDQVSEDWLHRFFKACQDIGDTEVQRLWSRILAGEFENPSTYSYRTLDAVRMMQPDEAQAFERIGYLAWRQRPEKEFPWPFLWSTEAARDYYRNAGLGGNLITHFEDIGLVSGGGLPFDEEGSLAMGYGDREYRVELDLGNRPAEPFIPINSYTWVGGQLFGLLEPKFDEEFHVIILESLRDHKAIQVTEL